MSKKDKYKVVPTEAGLHEIVEVEEDGKKKPMDPRQLFTEKHAAQRYAKTFNENEKKKGVPHNTTEEE